MRSLIVLVLILGLAAVGAAAAGERDKRPGTGVAQSTGKEFAHGISKLERQIISDYLHRHRGNLPPVFANADPLAPAITGRLAKARPLPPGTVKRPLPGNLIEALPPRPGYEWLVVGTDIVLTNAATGHVIGILSEFLSGRA